MPVNHIIGPERFTIHIRALLNYIFIEPTKLKLNCEVVRMWAKELLTVSQVFVLRNRRTFNDRTGMMRPE